MSNEIVKSISIENCTPIFDIIIDAYGLNSDKLVEQARFRDSDLHDVLCKAIFEKISLNLIAR